MQPCRKSLNILFNGSERVVNLAVECGVAELHHFTICIQWMTKYSHVKLSLAINSRLISFLKCQEVWKSLSP